MKTSFWLILIVGLQVIWMAGTSVLQEIRLGSAETVLLETMPVDPRDLLRGDYVILNYKISDIPVKLVRGMSTNSVDTATIGRTIYVVLERHGDYHEVESASFTVPEVKSSQVVISGTVAWGAAERNSPSDKFVHVTYGIERYYVREGTGNPRGKLTVRAVAPPNKKLMIKQVLVDGKPYAEAVHEQR